MKFFGEAARGEGAEAQAIDAFCFGDDAFFVVVQATDEEEEIVGSALLRVPMDAPRDFRVLDEFDTAALNYWTPGPELHFVHASGRTLRRVAGGRIEVFPFDQFDTSLMQMVGTNDGTVIVYGDNGLALRLAGDEFVRVGTDLTKNLHAMHMNSRGLAAAGGNFGNFSMGPIGSLQRVDLGIGGRITGLLVREDNSIAIAVKGDAARELREDELRSYDDHDEPWSSIAEFHEFEFWGDNEYGVFLRRADSFVPVFETQYAFRMNGTKSHLAITSSYAVRFFDGAKWRNFEVQTDPDEPLVEAELDFTPNWPV